MIPVSNSARALLAGLVAREFNSHPRLQNFTCDYFISTKVLPPPSWIKSTEEAFPPLILQAARCPFAWNIQFIRLPCLAQQI